MTAGEFEAGDLDTGERRARLRLARTDGVGPATFGQLIERFGSAAAALLALPELAQGRSPHIPSPQELEAEWAAGEAAGAKLLIWGSPEYPALLAASDGAPPVLWALGDVALIQRESIAIVGSRAASAAGRRIAEQLARELGEAGQVVISGLARGIDAAAHAGSLSTGAVAVLAGGVDRPYPPQNLALYEAIAERGCVVSERPVGHEARARDFPRRNRIISGLARAVVVVEAELRSGSLITARLAAEQGREVFAVPGSPLEPRSRGTNDLIRQGATLVECGDDVLRALDDLSTVYRARPREPALPAVGRADIADVDEITQELDRLLSPTPMPIDVLARETGAPMAAVLAALTELSLAGRAELLPGGMAAKA